MRPRADRPFYLNVWHTGAPGTRRSTPANTSVGARGMTVTLQDGTTVDDWGGGYFVNNIGAGRAAVAGALARQARRMSWISPSDFADARLALTRDLLAILPPGLTTPQYGVGGSDCMEAAIRAARMVTGRAKVLTFTRSYHGDTMTTENICGGVLTPYGDPRPWAVHTPSPYDLWEEAGHDWTLACRRALEKTEATLKRHGPRTFACVIVEPVMAGAGAVPLSADLSRGLRALCDRHGIKLVADEVITGFGRTGRWFGSQTVGLDPDAMVLAKGITGGYAPLGAVVFERSWGEELRRTGLNHGLTFGGHPLGCAAARQTIRILKEERLVDRARSLGRHLQGCLEEIRDAHPEALSDVRGQGLLLAIQFRSGRRLPAARRVAQVCAGALGEGIRLLPGSDGTSIVLCPPFTVSASRVARLLDVLERQVRAA